MDQGDGSSVVNSDNGIPISATSNFGMPKDGAANYMTPDRGAPNDKNMHDGIQNHKATNDTTTPNHAPNEGISNEETRNGGMSNEAKSSAGGSHAEAVHPSGSHINEKEAVDRSTVLPNDGQYASKRHGQCRDKAIADPWASGGVLFECLSASAEGALADGSKAVRVKALTCSLRILDAYEGNIQSEGVGKEFSSSCSSIATILSKVRHRNRSLFLVLHLS